ncbi:MAG: hypothetical protein QW292_06020 [Candidatus Parvarchaeota archaeon]
MISSGKRRRELKDALGKLISLTESAGREIHWKSVDMMKKLAERFILLTDTDLSLSEIVKG